MELADDDENLSSDGIARLIPIDCCNDMELILPISDDSESVASASGCSSKVKIENILDKSISVDADNLITPLEPVRLSPVVRQKEPKHGLQSVLRMSSDNESIYDSNSLLIKKVTFPTNIDELISYKELDYIYPFVILEQVSSQEIVGIYENSCLKNNTIEVKNIKTQLSEIKRNNDRSADLKLNNLNITYEVLETLEDIFKVANFKSIEIVDSVLTAGTVAVLFDMLEYYECTAQLVLSINLEQLDAWKLFCNMIMKTVHLESITLKSMKISDINMKNLMHSINSNYCIKSICFDSSKFPNFTLIEYLESNYGVRELRLLHAGLYTREADIIGRLLKNNYIIQILDVSNNLIGDRGLEHLARGLCQQNLPNKGISVLILFNNQITEKSGKTINAIITSCKNLRTLNVGFNNLTDTVVSDISDGLKETKSLEGLGLQATVLTCKGASALAEAIKCNTSLKKLNLKGNKAIYIEGLEKLSQALISSKISTVELDETNRSCTDTEGYTEVVKKIKEICTINKSLLDQSTEEELSRESFARPIFRKGSLNCEPYYNTSPSLPQTLPTSQSQLSTLSSCFSTPSRSRFSVSKVIDTVSKPVANSRFKVVAVSNVDLRDYSVGKISIVEEEFDDDDDEDVDNNGPFQNVRGSVSSIDSMESLTTSAIDTISDSSTPACESE